MLARPMLERPLLLLLLLVVLPLFCKHPPSLMDIGLFSCLSAELVS
jgi:hypothetical protein